MRQIDPEKVVARLKDNESLIDVLIAFEGFLDDLDLYAFKNWIDGEVVAGPEVTRYWVSVTLKYDYNKMPDPMGGMRLIKYDATIKYKLSHELVAKDVVEPSDFDDDFARRPKIDRTPIWLIDITIPRRFIEEVDDIFIQQEEEEDIIEPSNEQNGTQQPQNGQDQQLPAGQQVQPGVNSGGIQTNPNAAADIGLGPESGGQG